MPQRPLLACTHEGTTTGRKQSDGSPQTRWRAPAGDGVNICEPARYEIRVAGVLDSRWTAWFDGLRISVEGEETVIRGLVTKVRDLGLCLISVRRLDTGQAGNEAR